MNNQKKDYEAFVLGCLLLDPDLYQDYTLELEEKYFTGAHRTIFKKLQIYREINEKFDLLQFSTDTKTPMASLMEMIENLPSSTQFEDYYYKLKQTTISANLMQALVRATKMLQEDFTMTEEIVTTLRNVDITGLMKQEPTMIADVFFNEVEEQMKQKKHINTESFGVKDLDDLIDLYPSQLIYIAARPAVGKSTFALNLARKIAQTRKVAFFSFEMSKKEICYRIVGRESGLPKKKVTATKAREIFQEKTYYQTNFMAFDDPMTIEDFSHTVKMLKKRYGVQYVFVDYIGLLGTRESYRGNLNAKITDVSRQLKEIAMREKLTVICLSQMSRDIEKRKNKTPMLSDLRDSGSLEQDGNIVMMLEVAHKKTGTNQFDDAEVSDIADDEMLVHVLKNRDGGSGTVRMKYIRETYYVDHPQTYASQKSFT